MRLTLILTCLAMVCLEAVAARADDDALLPCQQYLQSMAALGERWNRVAQHVHAGEFDEARGLLATSPPRGLDDVWYRADAERQNDVTWFQTPHHAESEHLTRARAYFALGHYAWAAQMYADAKPRNVLEKHAQLQFHAHALALLGRYDEAAARVEALVREAQDESTRRQREQWVEALGQLAMGKLDIVDYLSSYAPPHGLGAILRVYDNGRGLQEARGRRLLTKLFDRADDARAARLLRELAAECKSEHEDAAGALLTLGNQAHERGDRREAIRLWQRAVDEHAGTRDWGKALFNIDVALKEQKELDGAISVFERLLASNVNDQEPGAHLMETFRNYRPRAAWEIAVCRLTSGDAATALDAVRTARHRYPFLYTCGHGHRESAYRYAAFEGACLEHSGRYTEAIGKYFEAVQAEHGDPFAPRRLVDMYESRGELIALVRICDEVDARHFAELRRAHPDAKLRPEYRPTAVIRRMMEIRTLGREGRMAELADLLRSNSANGPHSSGDVRANWAADEVARTLARHAAKSLPVLLERAQSPDTPDIGWVYFALGLNGAPQAIARLERELASEQGQWAWLTLVFALHQAGPRGEVVLDAHDPRMIQEGRRPWREALAVYEKSAPEPWPIMRPVPSHTSLPTRLADLKEDVRMTSSNRG